MILDFDSTDCILATTSLVCDRSTLQQSYKLSSLAILIKLFLVN